MKKKLFLPILIVAALGVWGIILYRIFIPQLQPVVAEPNNDFPAINQTMAAAWRHDTLNIDYADPFTKRIKTRKRVQDPQKSKAKKKKEPEEKIPEIIYIGMSKNITQNKVMAWVKIDGVEKVVTKGEKMGSLKFTSITNDKLKVKFNGKTYEYEKE